MNYVKRPIGRRGSGEDSGAANQGASDPVRNQATGQDLQDLMGMIVPKLGAEQPSDGRQALRRDLALGDCLSKQFANLSFSVPLQRIPPMALYQ
jgi:hypothetical protein